MTINKQLREWKDISSKYKEYRAFGFLDCNDKEDCVRDIQSLIKRYVVNYQTNYDPTEPPTNA